MEKKVIYYKDELNDDFADSKITPVTIDGKYTYIHKNPLWNIAAFIVYRVGALLPSWIYAKTKFGMKYVNKEVLKECKNKGYFVYINHTQEIQDTFTPTHACFPKRAYVIAHPNNVSIKGMKTLNKMLGALPIPGDIESTRNFLEAIKKLINKKRVIAVYPEAHIWPYYTKIRPYQSVSFKYPVKLNTPAYSITITYKKWKENKPRIVAYVDGPFYPNQNLTPKEAQEELRDKIYETMKKRSNSNDIEIIKYKKLQKEKEIIGV